jgi:hypothetical protein
MLNTASLALNKEFDMGGGETIADQVLKSFALPDVVGSKTSSKKLINLLRGHVPLLFMQTRIPFWDVTRPNKTHQSPE